MNTMATTKIEKVENDNNPYGLDRIMKRHVLLNRVLAVGLLALMVLVPVGQTAQAQGKKSKDLVPPDSVPGGRINGRLDSEHGRCVPRALGDPNNFNNPPPLDRSGRREINWDGLNPPMFWIQRPR